MHSHLYDPFSLTHFWEQTGGHWSHSLMSSQAVSPFNRKPCKHSHRLFVLSMGMHVCIQPPLLYLHALSKTKKRHSWNYLTDICAKVQKTWNSTILYFNNWSVCSYFYFFFIFITLLSSKLWTIDLLWIQLNWDQFEGMAVAGNFL